jgi:hypothetical protein
MSNQKQGLDDLSEKLRPYENMWVALAREDKTVIYAEKTLEALLKKVKGKESKAELFKVPRFDICYAP